MIPIELSAETTTRFGREAFREVSSEAWSAAGVFWHERLLPPHFQRSAEASYSYAPRSRSYMIQKATAKGHQRPLVYKGELERQVTRMRDLRTIRARGDDEGGVNIKLSGPKYLHQKPQPKQPNLAAEISAVSPSDAEQISIVIHETVVAALNQPGPPRKLGT